MLHATLSAAQLTADGSVSLSLQLVSTLDLVQTVRRKLR